MLDGTPAPSDSDQLSDRAGESTAIAARELALRGTAAPSQSAALYFYLDPACDRAAVLSWLQRHLPPLARRKPNKPANAAPFSSWASWSGGSRALRVTTETPLLSSACTASST